jgi:hypothetical protein
MGENGERGKRGNNRRLNAPLLLGAEGARCGFGRGAERPEVKKAAGPGQAHA